MVTHLLVALIGFGFFWFVHTRTNLEAKTKLIASIVIIGLTLGGLIVDAPQDCPVSAPTTAAPTP
jgi:hypothetical protein